MNSCITSQHNVVGMFLHTIHVFLCVLYIFCKIISKRLNFEKYVCAMNISFYIKRQFTARKTADKIRNIKTKIYFIHGISFIYIQSPQFYRRFVFTRIYHSRFNNFIVPVWDVDWILDRKFDDDVIPVQINGEQLWKKDHCLKAPLKHTNIIPRE